MDFKYTPEQEQLRTEIHDFSTRVLNNRTFVNNSPRYFTREDWELCGEAGILGLPVEKKFGGGGYDTVTTAIGLESLGYACDDAGLPFAIAAQMLSCMVPLAKFGSLEQKEKYLPEVCRGRLIVANSITEENTGSDVYRMESRARADGDIYILTGSKTLITNAPLADLSLVYMATNPKKGYFGGISAFLVDNSTEGVESDKILEKIGLESVMMGRQYFEEVKISKDQLLGNEGAGGPIFQVSMDWERACLGAIHVGLMQKIVEKTIEYSKKRKVGGIYISKNQAVAHKIAEMHLRLHSSRLMLYEAAWSLDHKKSPGISASMGKLYISEALQKTCWDAFSLMGGQAYLKGSFIEKYLRDSLSATIYSGTSDIQRNIISSYLGI